MTTLIIGDDFDETVTLMHGTPSAPYDLSQATQVLAAISSADSSKLLAGPVVCESNAAGADWVNGVVAIGLPEIETVKVRKALRAFGFVRVEIQVEIGGKKYTWSQQIEARNGVIE